MRIVHFSDVHVGCPPAALSAFFDKRILGSLNFFLRRRALFEPGLLQRALSRISLLNPDWVVCTGDLTSVGSPEEFEVAVARLAPILARKQCKLLYVPGNHDAYVRNRACRDALCDTFSLLNGGRWALTGLPQDFWMREIHFFVLGESVPTNWLLSSGELSPGTQERLASWLAAPRQQGEKRVLVGHFPLRNERGRPLQWRRRLRGAHVLEQAMAERRLDVLLCGHDHVPFVRREASGAMEICAGSLTASGRMAVLDYVPETGEFSHFWEDLSGDGPVQIPVGNELAAAAITD